MANLEEANLKKYLPLFNSKRVADVLFALRRLQELSGKVPKKILKELLERDDEKITLVILDYIREKKRNLLVKEVEAFLYHTNSLIRLRAFECFLSLETEDNFNKVFKLLAVEKDEWIVCFLLKNFALTENTLYAETLKSFVNHDIPRVRAQALESLFELSPDESTVLLKVALKDEHHRVRGVAQKVLLEKGELDLSEILNDMRSEDELIARTALFVRGSMEGIETYNFLLNELKVETGFEKRLLIIRLLMEYHFPFFQDNFFTTFEKESPGIQDFMLGWYSRNKPNMDVQLQKYINREETFKEGLFALLTILRKTEQRQVETIFNYLFEKIHDERRWRLYYAMKNFSYPEIEKITSKLPPQKFKEKLAWLRCMYNCGSVQSLKEIKNLLLLGEKREKLAAIRIFGRAESMVARKFLVDHLEKEKNLLVRQKILSYL
ncbi:HEAT repeat domain-containing protein [Candidatus Riflebacteria bacterium]